MAKIVGVKFKNAGKVYYFDPRGELFRDGEGVIVETAKGLEYGVAAGEVRDVPEEEVVQPLKPVVRRATQKDEESRKRFMEKRPETMRTLRDLIDKSGLEMKLVDAEYSFDGSKLFVYFSAENRVDFRELVHAINTTLKTRVDLRQIGIRDEAKMLGGFAPCGRPCCCSAFLQDFKKVSIKMAKTQGLSLNPGKISGLCGRLMCCLDYENDYYAEVSKQMPKIGAQVETEDGVGTVVSNNMLKLITRVKFSNPDGTDVYRDYETATMKAQHKAIAENQTEEKAESAAEDADFPQEKPVEKKNHSEKHRDHHRHGENANPEKQGEKHKEKHHGERKPHKEERPVGEGTAEQANSARPGGNGNKNRHHRHHHHRPHEHGGEKRQNGGQPPKGKEN